MKRIDARFVLSAAAAAHFPRTGLPEVALVGRSNVGKSSLINALVAKKIARTSAAPGKTRLANYYLVESPGSLYVVDLPGYGYARGGTQSRMVFDTLVQEYFDSTPERRIAGVLHLIDARHPELPQDEAASRWLCQTGVPIVVVATKMDQLTQSEQSKTTRALEKRYDWPVLPVSVLNGRGHREIWKVVLDWASHA